MQLRQIPGSRFLVAAVLTTSLLSATFAQNPEGFFACRRFQHGGDTGGGTLGNVAIMRLFQDGSYSAKDLTTSVPKVHGHFTYNVKSRTIEWDAGIWKTLLGHYFPNVAGTDVVMVTTRSDPEGKIDGALQCVRFANGNKQ